MKSLVARGAAPVALLLVCGCTTANPAFVGSAADLATAADLGGSDGASGLPDLAPACVEGARSCASATTSAVCQGGAIAADRVCPADSTCQDGVCTAPPDGPGAIGRSCDDFGGPSENACFSGGAMPVPSCQPFVVDDPGQPAVEWVCGRPVGDGGPGAPCTSGAQCRTGFCTGKGICFRSCRTVGDCPTPQPGRVFGCDAVTLVVDGVSVTAGSCVPQ
jgi:hypothetical protein